MPPKRTTTPMTDAAIKALIAQGVATALAENVMASKPKTMQDAIEIANDLMDQKIRTFAERQAENKRKLDNDNQAQQQPPKKQNVARAYSAGSSEKKEYAGTLPCATSASFTTMARALSLRMIKDSTASSSTLPNVSIVSETPAIKEEKQRRDGWNTGNRDGNRTGKKEESKALVTVDGESIDWTTHSKDDDDYALMLNNNSGFCQQLPDENQILLKVPRQNNMYSFNLENIVPLGEWLVDCKGTTDDSNLWHRRLGHFEISKGLDPSRFAYGQKLSVQVGIIGIKERGKREWFLEDIRIFLAFASYMGYSLSKDVKSAFSMARLRRRLQELGMLPLSTSSCACSVQDHSNDSPFDCSKGFIDSTTGGCQFLGRRLITWQCKKQTIVATSTTEAEYVKE
ncbi:hypothetical protein Tco_1525982 [Tanacetum coccineum]